MSQLSMVSRFRLKALSTWASEVRSPTTKVHTFLVLYVEEDDSPLRCMIGAVGPLASISSSFNKRFDINSLWFCVRRRIRIAKSLRTYCEVKLSAGP